MQRPRGHRLVTARQLVRALRPGFDLGQAMADGEVDCLIIAGLEMQAGVVLGAAPIAAIESIAADEVQRPGDPAAVAFAKNQQGVVAHGLVDQVEECAGQIRAPPFPHAGILIKLPEHVPVSGLNRGAGELADRDPVGDRLGALPADLLALAR